MAKKYENLEEVKQMLRECIADDDSPEDAKEAARRALAAVEEDDDDDNDEGRVQPVRSLKDAARAQRCAQRRAAARTAVGDYSAEGLMLRKKLHEMRGISAPERAALASLPAPQLRAAMLKIDPVCLGIDGVVDGLKRRYLRGQ